MIGFSSRPVLAFATLLALIPAQLVAGAATFAAEPAAPAPAPPAPAPAPVPVPPAPSALTVPTLFEAMHSLLFDHLANTLSNNPSLDRDALNKEGLTQFSRILQVARNDPNATPSELETKLIGELCGLVYIYVKRTNPGPVTPPTTYGPPAPTTYGPPASTLPVAITGGVRDKLKARLVEADTNFVKTVVNDDRPTPSQSERQAALKKFVTEKPKGRAGGGTFLDLFNALTGLKATEYAQLNPDDQKTVDAMIGEVIGLAPSPVPPTPPTGYGGATPPTPAKPDPVVEAGEDIVSVLGDILPAYAPFERLTDDAIQYVVPAIERWRPFQRLRLRPSRRAILVDDGGAVTTSGGRAVYICP